MRSFFRTNRVLAPWIIVHGLSIVLRIFIYSLLKSLGCIRIDLTWDPYLGEVTISEKVEEPSQYVPPPPVSAEGIFL